MQPARRGECAPIVHSRRRAEDCPPYQASRTAGPYSGQIFDAANRWLQQWSRAIGRDFNRLLLLHRALAPVPATTYTETVSTVFAAPGKALNDSCFALLCAPG